MRNVEFVRISNDDVAPGRATADMKPEIVPFRDFEGEMIVVVLTASDQHLETVDDDGAVRTPLAAHGWKITDRQRAQAALMGICVAKSAFISSPSSTRFQTASSSM